MPTYTEPEYTPGGFRHEMDMMDESVRLRLDVSLMGTAGMYACATGRAEKMRVEMDGMRKRWEMVMPGMIGGRLYDGSCCY
jgi:hypothetical protein